jgi:hypothetical protein
MQEVEFYQLQRSVQDRFVRATRGDVPVPLMVSRPPQRAPVAWMVGGAAALMIPFALGAVGFGTLDSRLAIQPVAWAAAYAAIAVLGVFCILRGIALRQRSASMPYRPWVFFFPAGIVDAREPRLRVSPLDEFEGAETVEGSSVVGAKFSGGARYEFDVGEAGKVEQALSAIEEARRRWTESSQSANARDRALLDPLVDSGYSSPFSPTTQLSPPRVMPAWLLVIVPVIAGTVVGVGAWYVRNRLSEGRMYVAARAADRPEQYREYLARGGKRADIRDVLLPRSELRAVREVGTPEAIENYVAAYPNSKIQVEVDLVHRAILLQALTRAKEAGTLSALLDLEQRHPGSSLIVAQLAAAKTAVFQRALNEFQAAAAQPGGALIDTFTALLRHSQKHGPKVQIRFKRIMPRDLAKMEKAVRKHRFFLDETFLPLRYFGLSHAQSRERHIAGELMARFEKIFPKDILSFELGPRLKEEEDLKTVQQPTLYIERKLSLSGRFPSRDPRGVYVGLGVNYRAELLVPGTSEPLAFKFSTWSRPLTKILEEEGKGPPDVYEHTMQVSLDKFVRKLKAFIFAEP